MAEEINMANLPCIWPACGKAQKVILNIPVLKSVNGKLEQVQDKAVPTPFCNYHRWIAISGLCAVLAKNEGLTDLEFIAPFDAIKAAEAVNLANVMLGRERGKVAEHLESDKGKQKEDEKAAG